MAGLVVVAVGPCISWIRPRARRSTPGWPCLDRVAAWLAGATWSVQVGIGQELTVAIGALTAGIDRLSCALRQRVAQLAPQLLSLPGCGVLTAAKLIAETAGVARVRSEAGFAMPAGWRPSRSARDGPTATGCVGAGTGS